MEKVLGRVLGISCFLLYAFRLLIFVNFYDGCRTSCRELEAPES